MPRSKLLNITVKSPKMSQLYLPLFLEGEVIKGFGRGSRELGCPTANFPLSVVQSLPADLECGVYYGWAKIGSGPIHKMVANIGWCPFYQNKEKSVETHVIKYRGADFYGMNLKIALLGYLRGELNFSSVEELKKAINQDIVNSEKHLDSPNAQTFKDHKFFVCT